MNLFDQDNTDFTKMSSGEIFNNTVVSILDDLDSHAASLEAKRVGDFELLNAESQETSDLLSALPMGNSGTEEDVVDYNAPFDVGAESQPQIRPQPQVTGGGFKLSNYGYASDSSPDYNSNVLRIGHANNKLEDGVSAALTKSLANRYGLKTGDMFEITTADGNKQVRRYDDTVPTTYKGKPLPETVDLYEIKGSNKFGGRVTQLKKL